jgi:hypothetical protein
MVAGGVNDAAAVMPVELEAMLSQKFTARLAREHVRR